jgi:hypothetical protein
MRSAFSFVMRHGARARSAVHASLWIEAGRISIERAHGTPHRDGEEREAIDARDGRRFKVMDFPKNA